MRFSHILQSWRNASTLILAARPPVPHEGSAIAKNLQILMLERSSKSSFFPSAYVFPGGRISDHDFSQEWQEVFSMIGIDDISKTLSPVMQHLSERSPMFTQKLSGSIVPNDIAYRLCAIRETFEESGILLYKKAGTHIIHEEHVREWRKVVHKDAAKFTDCCKALGVVPDVWSLHEWSNWLTPTNMPKMHKGRRYDTAFYLTCLDQPPPDVQEDEKEVVSSRWRSPVEYIKEMKKEKVYLAPPQIYELERLCNFEKLEELSNFARQREEKGSSRWMPVRMNCTDAIITVLPGDSLYPGDQEVDLEGDLPVKDLNASTEELLNSSEHVNRFELRSMFDCSLRCNIPATHGHKDPVPEHIIFNHSN